MSRIALLTVGAALAAIVASVLVALLSFAQTPSELSAPRAPAKELTPDSALAIPPTVQPRTKAADPVPEDPDPGELPPDDETPSGPKKELINPKGVNLGDLPTVLTSQADTVVRRSVVAGGVRYSSGLIFEGSSSGRTITLSLDQDYSSVRLSTGLAGAGPPDQNYSVEVLVDGQVRSKALTNSDPDQVVSTRGAQQLTLSVRVEQPDPESQLFVVGTASR